MREKLETLPLAQLRELAKSQGIRNVSSLRKSELIDRLCAISEQESEKKEEEQSQAHTQRVGNGEAAQAHAQRAGNGEAAQTHSSAGSAPEPRSELQELDSGIEANGILEVMPDGFGFIRCENFLPGENDVYVAPSQIRRFNMKTGDIVRGSRRVKTATEKFAALLYVTSINGYPPFAAERRPNFEDLTPIFPDQRLNLEVRGGKNTVAMRVMDLLAPIGKGQRGMIVSPAQGRKNDSVKAGGKGDHHQLSGYAPDHPFN